MTGQILARVAALFCAQGAAARGIFIAVITAIVFGAHTPAEQGVFANGGNISLVLVVTMWVRALAMMLFCGIKRRKLFLTREDTKQALIGGACQALSVLCILWALLYLPAPVVIIIVFSHTLMLLLFMAWRGEIALDAPAVFTTIAALGGLTLVIDLWGQQAASGWKGIGLGLVAAVATVSRLYVYGHQTKLRNPIVVGAENLLFGAILASFLFFFVPPQLPQTQAGYGWLAVASVSLAVGSFGMFYGISLLGSFRYSLFVKLEPVFTALFSIWFLGEYLKAAQYLGILVVIGSLVLYQYVEQRRVRKLCPNG